MSNIDGKKPNVNKYCDLYNNSNGACLHAHRVCKINNKCDTKECPKKKTKPLLIEKFADNGGFSHYELIDVSSGIILWTSSEE